jgi:hypothetical protein
MDSLKNRNFNPDTLPGEYNVVALWTRFRAERIKAGLFAGIFAGVMMQVFGMVYSLSQGMDVTTPMRISALPILGNRAMEIGSSPGILIGLFMFFLFQSELTTYLLDHSLWHFLRSSYLSIAICRSGLWAAVEYDKLCRFYAFFFFFLPRL